MIDEIVEVPQSEVEGKATLNDGSQRFTLVGGPYHNLTMRLYPPWDRLVFPSGLTYEIHPPVRKGGKWVYVHVEQQHN